MTILVLTAHGNDQTGLVDRLSGIITDGGGNWDTSHMARLAGKFAGIVQVSIPEDAADSLIESLLTLKSQEKLDLVVERVPEQEPAARSTQLSLQLAGQDHPGILHDIAKALADSGVGIEELRTETTPAPIGGGSMFRASVLMRAPADLPIGALFDRLETIASDLMVDIELADDEAG